MSLTTQDKRDIKEIIDEALTDFADKLIKPSFELVFKRFKQNDERLRGIEEKLEEHDRRFDKLDDRLDRHGKQLENHGERITKLEKISPATF